MAKATEVEAGEQKAPVIAAGAYFRLHHRQDQRDCAARGRSWADGFLGMFICFMILHGFCLRWAGCSIKGVGIWGVNIPDRLGIRHRQLRVVDRYRPRRHADLGHSASVAAELAQLDQPLCRSDDVVCRGLRRDVPAASPRAPMARSTGCSLIRTPWTYWPQFRSPLVWDVFAVSTYLTISLVFWFVGLIPDLATLARPDATMRANFLRHCWRWAGAARRATGTVMRRRICCWPDWQRRWCSRCTPL